MPILTVANILPRFASSSDVHKWAYTNRVHKFSDSTAQDALDLLRLSDKWLLKDLKRLCEGRLMDLMTVCNVSKMLCAAEEYDAKRLHKATVKFCLENIKEVTGSKEFREEMVNFPHLCIPILTEAANLMPEPVAKKQKVEHVVKEEEERN